MMDKIDTPPRDADKDVGGSSLFKVSGTTLTCCVLVVLACGSSFAILGRLLVLVLVLRGDGDKNLLLFAKSPPLLRRYRTFLEVGGTVPD